MINSYKFLVPVLFAFVSVIFLSFIKPVTACQSVKNGIFYFYQNHYRSIVIRKDSLQTEINLTTGDTTYWRISWFSDCEFSCKYISGSKIKSPQETDFYKTSTLTFNIIRTTKKYYVYDAEYIYNNYSQHFMDTMWFKPRYSAAYLKAFDKISPINILVVNQMGDTLNSPNTSFPSATLQKLSALKPMMAKLKILSFDCIMVGAGYHDNTIIKNEGPKFNDAIKSRLTYIREGTTLVFKNIKIKNEEGLLFTAPPIALHAK